MQKIKKFLKIAGIVLILMVGILVALPFLFKGEIKKAIEKEINNNVNAVVTFEDFGLNLFSNFPNFTVTLDKLKVMGKDEFAGVKLASVDHFRLVLNLKSVISGDEIEVRKVTLDQPDIHVIVKKNGKANYDIMISDSTEVVAEEEEPTDTSGSSFALKLKKYQIRNGNVIYEDHMSDMRLDIVNLNHSGSGDFTETVFGFDTKTTIDQLTFDMEGTKYLNEAVIDADVNLLMDTEHGIYVLEENSVGINELVLGVDGTIKMPAEDINLDLSYHTNKNTFKSILSMAPGAYTEDFKEIDTDGTFDLNGTIIGDVTETDLPTVTANLNVANGYLRYPDLPEAVKNINFDVKVNLPHSDPEQIEVNMPQFHCEFGSSPIDAKLIMQGLTNMNIDGNVKADLDLGKMMEMFPMDSMELKGQFAIDATAKGIYNEEKGSFPVVNASMSLTDGFYKYEAYPIPIEDMNMAGTVVNTDGSTANTVIDIAKFHALIDGEPMDATLHAENLDNVAFNVTANGSLDLEKIDKIYPMEEELSGKVYLRDIKASGLQSDVEAERYTKVLASGSVDLENVVYQDPEYPQIKIMESNIGFTPSQLTVNSFKALLGTSDVNLTGSVNNYLAYALLDNQPLSGTFTMVSSKFDCNEWLTEETETDEPVEDTGEEDLYVFEVPAGFDMVFTSTMNTVLYDNMTLSDLKGRILMKDQKIVFEQINFNTLGGSFAMSGDYNTVDPKKPGYNFDLGIRGLDMQESYKTFNTMQQLAPIAEYINGHFNADINTKGDLGMDMMPLIESVTAGGNLKMLEGKLTNFKVLDQLSDKTKLKDFKELNIADTKIFFDVKDGRVTVEPFDVKAGKTNMNVVGSSGLDGTLDYDLDLDIPAGAAGAAASSALSGLTGSTLNASDNLDVQLGLGGTWDKPKITGAGSSVTDQLTDVVEDKIEDVKETVEEAKDSVKQVVDDKVEDVKEDVNAQIDKIMKDAEVQANKIRQEARKNAEKVRKEGYAAAAKGKQEGYNAADKLEAEAKNPLAKAAAKKAADKLRKEADEKEIKAKGEVDKNANKIIAEGDKKADKVVADARARADKLKQ